MLRIGAWRVDRTSGEISRDGEVARLEVRPLKLLLCLAEHAGEVVSIDDLLTQAWPGVIVSPDSVYQAVASLRRVLGDDPKQPTYIETVPRLGYRLVATVEEQPRPGTAESPARGARRGAAIAWAAGASLCIAAVAAFFLYGRMANSSRPGSPGAVPQPPKSIAVLPFLDLTAGMTQEEFADGMTEELLDRLSKLPGLRVHAPTPSLKHKRTSIVDMAKMLDVAYVLDGSVRKSGTRMRVAARLLRGTDESVVWSETYDRPVDDILTVQDDIAGEVTKALSASIDGSAPSAGRAEAGGGQRAR